MSSITSSRNCPCHLSYSNVDGSLLCSHSNLTLGLTPAEFLPELVASFCDRCLPFPPSHSLLVLWWFLNFVLVLLYTYRPFVLKKKKNQTCCNSCLAGIFEGPVVSNLASRSPTELTPESFDTSHQFFNT